MLRGLLLASLLTLGWVGVANAHFVWIVVDEPGAASPAVRLYFSDDLGPGEARLVNRLSQAEVSMLSPQGSHRLRLSESAAAEEGTGEMRAMLADKRPQAAEATLRYGLFSRGDRTSLLNYNAKYLDADPAAFQAYGKSERLTMDVVPRLTDDGVVLEVLFEGKPAEGVQLTVQSDEGSKTLEPQDGAAHRFLLGELPQGLIGVRARLAVDKPGEEDGQAYTQEIHITTLTLRRGGQQAAANPPVAEDATSDRPAASDLLGRVRASRAAWREFPGFTADVTVRHEGEAARGTISVEADGSVTFEGLPEAVVEKIARSIESLVSHRLASDDDADRQGKLLDEAGDHPLGQLVGAEGDAMGSSFRIRDDVIRQVNRAPRGGKFTISVMDVHRNAEGQTLPRFYTVSFWNADGSLRTTNTVRDEWTRIGEFDLPTLHLRVMTGVDSYEAIEVGFANHKLLK